MCTNAEAFANVLVAGFMMLVFNGGAKAFSSSSKIPQNLFTVCSFSQVSAKAFTNMSMQNGVSFPVVTLAKSGKMVPVMLGSIVFGGAKYSLREYASVLAIIAGTCIVSMGGGKKNDTASSTLGLALIVLSLACDGVVAGFQKKVKDECKTRDVKLGQFEFMFYTNFYMALVGFVISLAFSEFMPGILFCRENPSILQDIVKFCVCSAIGQSFIFYTISEFDPLTCTTVTTTRKVFSVILSIFLNGHEIGTVGWIGLGLASAGILAELVDKSGGGGHHKAEVDEKKKK